MKLNELKGNPGARKERMRVGRGIGCTKGKTCGRGVKGQKARTGVALKGFEGGQMPIYRRAPKMGFTKRNQSVFAEVNLGRLQEAIDTKKLDAKKTVDAAALKAAGVVRGAHDGIRLLAQGELTTKLTLQVAGASKAAIAAVEKAGGKVEIVFFTPKPVLRKKPKQFA